jgi:hypothetical protein
VALVRERNIPTELPPLVGEVIANVCGLRVSGQSGGSPLAVISLDRTKHTRKNNPSLWGTLAHKQSRLLTVEAKKKEAVSIKSNFRYLTITLLFETFNVV